MSQPFDPKSNYVQSRALVDYIERSEATSETYRNLGFKCGLEIHQQLDTRQKLFCRCPAGLYADGDDYDSELIRHMRPTLSEMGEYDGTALMERKTKKRIIYRIKNESACTYDIDDTPPFPLNRQALDIAIEVALLLKTNIVGELHITRKQYLDGSIPTGFQRTGIIGIEGEIPLEKKKIGIIQLSLEEDACREVFDRGHDRMYTTDRLGMPLIETVTYPDMVTPDEAAEVAHYLRFLARSTGKVRVGIGAAREDVNVSINGGTRVEIKGVSHISWIPALTHNEAFRQKALLEIRSLLRDRVADPDDWHITHLDINSDKLHTTYLPIQTARGNNQRLTVVNLPNFAGLLSFFVQTGMVFADELSGRLKVIACLDRPNMLHSEQHPAVIGESEWDMLRKLLGASPADAQIIVWGPDQDVTTALETIEERCRLGFGGVPNETRKAFEDGTTVFERVLPGPDRMYPDTDSAPISIEESRIEQIRRNLPPPVSDSIRLLQQWKAPRNTYKYILRNNLVELIHRIISDFGEEPTFIAGFFGYMVKNIEGKLSLSSDFSYEKVYDLFRYVHDNDLKREILFSMMPVVYMHPNMDFESVLTTVGFERNGIPEILSYIPTLKDKFERLRTTNRPDAEVNWIMGNLRTRAVGNIALSKLRKLVEKELHHG